MVNCLKIIEEYYDITKSSNDIIISILNALMNEWGDTYHESAENRTIETSHIINRSISLLNVNAFLPNDTDISKWEEWHKCYMEDSQEHLADGHNFNIFHLLRDEFGFIVKETMHSKLIKYLLNPLSPHGQGTKFLIEFLSVIGIDVPSEGAWFVTAEESGIDILLKRAEPQSIIVIENKSNWAKDQPNQLYRYWLQEIYSKAKRTDYEFYTENKGKYQIIYLPPNEYKRYDEQSITIPSELLDLNLPRKIPMDIRNLYFNSEIQMWLENCKNSLPETNHRIREYISQYQILCNYL